MADINIIKQTHTHTHTHLTLHKLAHKHIHSHLTSHTLTSAHTHTYVHTHTGKHCVSVLDERNHSTEIGVSFGLKKKAESKKL